MERTTLRNVHFFIERLVAREVAEANRVSVCRSPREKKKKILRKLVRERIASLETQSQSLLRDLNNFVVSSSR